MGKLTNKQKVFVHEYIKDFNATQAAIRAGYSKNTAQEIGSQNLSKLVIKTEILKQFDKYGDATQKVIAEHFKIATSDITDFVEIDELTGTVKVKPLKEIPEGMTSVIKKIREKRVIKENADGSSSTVYDNVEYELYDKQKAQQDLLKIAKLLTDKIEVDLKGEISYTVSDKFLPKRKGNGK